VDKESTIEKTSHPKSRRPKERLSAITVRFAGDSGDGMQLTGDQFSDTSAVMGNDFSTLPDFPAEIRAPVGTLPGVSSFQIQISDFVIYTPGDFADVLIAMNPAALSVNIQNVKKGGLIIVNENVFNEQTLKKAGWKANPRQEVSRLENRHSFNVDPRTDEVIFRVDYAFAFVAANDELGIQCD